MFVAEVFWRGADLAKDLYQNATLEKIKLIKTLINRERNLGDFVSAWKKGVEVGRALSVP